MCSEKNIYLPYLMRIAKITEEAPAVKTFRLEFVDEAQAQAFEFKTGQFGLYSAFGEGESTFCIASSPTRKGYIECTFREVGRVTAALADKEVGDIVGFRGPYGNVFPLEAWKGKKILYVLGGIGSAALKATIEYTLEHREDYAGVSILYGATHPTNFTYWYDVQEWQKRTDIDLTLTIDRECDGWQCDVGMVPTVLERMNPDPANTIAITCGPPIMIKFALIAFEKLGFTPEQTYTTLEKRMKCGIGICGRCNIGPKYVCVDGPVFSLAELNELPDEI